MWHWGALGHVPKQLEAVPHGHQCRLSWKLIGAECTVISRESSAKIARRCWNRVCSLAICVLRITRSRMPPLVSVYACLPRRFDVCSRRRIHHYLWLKCKRCWNWAVPYMILYPQNDGVSYALSIWTYAAHAQVQSDVCSEGMVGVLQFKATVWPKVASESTYDLQNFLGGASPRPPSLASHTLRRERNKRRQQQCRLKETPCICQVI